MMFWGCLRFEMNVHKPFFLCGHSFQNKLGFQRDSSSFGSYVSNRGESTLLAVVSKGGSAALAGGIQRRAEPSWREESNETGGFVAHDFARKV